VRAAAGRPERENMPRFTERQYDEAIERLAAAKAQLEPNGKCCAVCGDEGHQAFECRFNPLLAMHWCQLIAKQSDGLHDTLHFLAGYSMHMGVPVGPAATVLPGE
jgi:hypothetical protein